MPRLPVSAALLILLILAGCAESGEPRQEPTPDPVREEAVAQAPEVASVEPVQIGNIPRLTRVGSLYFGGQPVADDMQLLADAGVTTVINLRHEMELDGFDEEGAAEAAGMRYEAVPWNGPTELTDDVFDRVRELLRAADGSTLLHCASSNRVGAVWLPFRVLDQGVELEQAVTDARAAGMRSEEYEALARDYVARNR